MFVPHPNDLIFVYFKVVRKGKAMVNRHKSSAFDCAFWSVSQFLDHKDISFVTITVQNPQIEDGNLMYFANLELVGAEIAYNVIVLHELLQGAVFGPRLVQISLLLRNNGSLTKLFKVETRVIKLNVYSSRYSMEMFVSIE